MSRVLQTLQTINSEATWCLVVRFYAISDHPKLCSVPSRLALPSWRRVSFLFCVACSLPELFRPCGCRCLQLLGWCFVCRLVSVSRTCCEIEFEEKECSFLYLSVFTFKKHSSLVEVFKEISEVQIENVELDVIFPLKFVIPTSSQTSFSAFLSFDICGC